MPRDLLFGYGCGSHGPRVPDGPHRAQSAPRHSGREHHVEADAVAFSSPEAIVLFGGLAKSGDYIFKPIQESIDKNVLNIYKGKTKLLMSELKDADAAVLGASALGWELK